MGVDALVARGCEVGASLKEGTAGLVEERLEGAVFSLLVADEDCEEGSADSMLSSSGSLVRG